MKKIVSYLLVLMLVLSLALTGCKTAPSAPSDPAAPATEKYDIELWYFAGEAPDAFPGMQEMFDGLASEYASQNPGITVKTTVLPSRNRETRMMTAFAAGNGPDCAFLTSDILALFQFNDVVVPLDEYIQANTLDLWTSDMLKLATINNKLYGLPCCIDICVPCYNLDLLAKIGLTEKDIPTTWDEFDKLLEKCADGGLTPIYLPIAGGPIVSSQYAMLFSEGCSVVDITGNITLDNPAGIKCFERWAKWFQNGWSPKDSISVSDQNGTFIEGNVATCLPMGCCAFYAGIAPKLTFNWTTGPVLAGDADTVAMGAFFVLGVTKDCKNIPATVKYLEYFNNDENSTKWANFLGLFSPHKNFVSASKDLKGYDVVIESAKYVKGNPDHAVSRTMSPLFITNTQAIASGSVSVADGVANLKSEIQAKIDDMNFLIQNPYAK